MTWAEIGWALIGLGAVLLLVFGHLFKGEREYQVRQLPAVKRLLNHRVKALEQGKARHIILGGQFWSRPYPGLGFHTLFILPDMINKEDLVEGGQVVFTGSGELAVFAHQIITGRYQNGFSPALYQMTTTVPGLESLAFTAGLLPEVAQHPPGSTAIFGNYGVESVLWAEIAQTKGGHVFSAAGTLSAQAALFLTVRDLLIGEEVFLLPGMIKSSPANQAGWFAEDILRIVLITLMIIISILKLSGAL